MTHWRIVPALPSHIPCIAAHMRDADRREVWASHRHTPEEALRTSLDYAEINRAWTCLLSVGFFSSGKEVKADRGGVDSSVHDSPDCCGLTPHDGKSPAEMVPAFMWGVSRTGSILSTTATPWLLGTDAIRLVARDFLRHSRGYVYEMQRGFERLENYVHAENVLSRRWLIWCGFTIEMNAPVFFNGEVFYPFWREGDV